MDIVKSTAGKTIKSPSGYTAFIPNPLPPKINWTTQLVNALSHADFLLGKLAREGGKLLNPYLTTNRIAEELKISYSTAQRGVQKLEETKIIKQINSNKRDKIYCATEILAILEEPTRISTYSP